jgi:hypothetical protein
MTSGGRNRLVRKADPMTGGRLAGAMLVLYSTLVLTACYESAFPIDARPKAEIDRSLPGTWRCLPFDQDPSEKPATLTIAAAKGQLYTVTLEEDGGQPSRYEVYASTAADGLMNVRELADGDKKPWMFVRATLLRPAVMQLQVLDRKALPEQKTPEELRRAIDRARGKPGTFTDVCICVRAREEKAGAQ